MSDKRISQLVERVTLANNDVFPIVASGAATTNKVTLQTIDDYMQTNLDFGVTSVAMSVPTGLTVTGTPITSTGTFVVTFTAGYSIPTTAKQTQWDTAYTNRITSATAPLGIASNVISITQSGAASNGYLSSTDWNTFNNKQATITTGNLTESTSSVLTITGGTSSVLGSGTTIQVTQANGSQDGFLDSADWTTFNGKQNALSGTGIVKSTGGTITYLTDSTSNWDSAYNNSITGAAVTGTTTKTLTLTQQDAGTITATWTDDNTDAVTSVFGRTGVVVATSGDYTTTQVTEGTNLYYTEARVNANTNVAANTAARHNAVTIGTANGLSLSTQALSLALATTSVTGALSSTDWNTFNGKQSALGYTAANDSLVVHLAGTETISGAKTFSAALNGTSATFSGNVGIGVTPIITSGGAFSQIFIGGSGQGGVLYGQNNAGSVALVANGYYNASNLLKYINSVNGVGQIYNYNGEFIFSNAPVGTSGNTVTLTPRFTIASTGAATFSSTISASNLSGTNTGDQTLAGLGGQPALNGTGFVKAAGTTITYDNSTYYLASNPSGYISSYTETDTLASVVGRGSATTATISVGDSALGTTGVNIRRGRLCFSSTYEQNHSIYNNHNNIDSEGVYDGMKMNVYNGLKIRTGNAASGVPTTIFSLDSTGVAITGNISATNFSGTHSGTSSGTNTGDQTLAGLGGIGAGFTTTGTLSARTAMTTYRDHDVAAPDDAPIKSRINTEDNWIYLDAANAQWGIYHRNIDSDLAVAGQPTLPNNSIAYIGANIIASYVSLATGNGYYRGTLSASNLSGTNTGDQDLSGYVTLAGTQTITGSKTFSATINAGDSITMGGELYYGGTTTNRKARAYTTGTEGSATLNYSFWTGSAWSIISTLTSGGAANFTGALTAYNLSGTNTGDQTLAGLGGVPTSRTITINGVGFDLSADRSYTVTGTDATKLPLAGGVLTGSVTSNLTNGYGFVMNRPAITNYIGIVYQTAASNKWFVGLRELSTNHYYIYNEVLGTNAVTIDSTNNYATFASQLQANSIYFDESGVRSWSITKSGGNLNYNSGDGAGTASFGTAISSSKYISVTRAGANGVGEGPYFVIAQPTSSIQWLMQLNASAGLDYWHYSGSAWSTPLKLQSNGFVSIGGVAAGSKLSIYDGDIRLYKPHVIGGGESWKAYINFTDEIDRLGARIVGERTAWDGAPMGIGFDTGGVGTVTRRMSITSTGNLLIGSSTSDNGTHKLQVQGKIRTTDNILVTAASEAWAEGVAVSVPTMGAWGGFRIRREKAAYDGNWYFGYVGGDSSDDFVWGCSNVGVQTDDILRLTKVGGNILSGKSVANSFGATVKSIQINGAGGSLLETSHNGTSGLRIGSGSDHSYHHDPRNAEMRFATSDSTRFYIYGNGNYSFTGSNVSDRRAKENIFALDISATDKIMSLQAKTYNMKNNPSQKRYGFIAQDVREILSDLVIGNDNDGYLGLDYDGLLSVAIKALQEQNIEIQKLKNK